MASSRTMGVVAAATATAGVLLVPSGSGRPAVAWAGASAAPVEAYFARRSYATGDRAVLVLPRGGALRLRILRAGRERFHERDLGEALGRALVVSPSTRRFAFRVSWPTGVYFARIHGPGRRLGYAPLIVRPRRLGESAVAVVLPTHTWQAYNFRDQDGDGVGDTWYASSATSSVRLDRAFLDRGVPPHYRHYDRGFLRWLTLGHRKTDFLAQEDVAATTGDALRRAYELIVFPGHHEYVTAREYDAVQRFRDLGGNLAFLSANNVFWRVDRVGNSIVRIAKWRDLGRPESRLVGVQYVDWYEGRWRSRPFTVTSAHRAHWLFEGTGLVNGDRFGSFGIEVDARTRWSPRGTIVLARIRDVFGPGKTAEMTYYETPAGARVFAAGAFTLGGAALWPDVSRLLDNLWQRLAAP